MQASTKISGLFKDLGIKISQYRAKIEKSPEIGLLLIIFTLISALLINIIATRLDSILGYWAVVGLHLLKATATPSVEILQNALRDESDEIKIMAAWTLVNLGRKEIGLECLRNLLYNGTTAERKLLNVLDWMGADAVPLVKEYLQSNPKKAKNILAKIAQDHGIEVPK